MAVLKNSGKLSDYWQARKMEAVERLSAGITHTINNPLSGILQSTQLLQRAFDTAHPRTVQLLKTLGFAETSIQQLTSFIENRKILSFSRTIHQCASEVTHMVAAASRFTSSDSQSLRLCAVKDLVNNAIFLVRQDAELRNATQIKTQEISTDDVDSEATILTNETTVLFILYELIRLAVLASEQNRQSQNPTQPLTFQTHVKSGDTLELTFSCHLPVDMKTNVFTYQGKTYQGDFQTTCGDLTAVLPGFSLQQMFIHADINRFVLRFTAP